MSRWVAVGRAEEIPEGSVRVVVAAGQILALARWGSFYALDNLCPHAGGSLGDGYLVRGTLHCSWHEWPFELATGRCDPENACVRAYPVRVQNGSVEVDLDGTQNPIEPPGEV